VTTDAAGRREAWPPVDDAPPGSWLERLCTSPPLFVPTAAVLLLGFLGLDHFTDLGTQVLLGLVTWVLLLVAVRYLSPEHRAQLVLVMAVATCAEVIGSIIWGVYEYRLGNLPLFVPPGHGLVYLTGLRVSQSRLVRGHPRGFVGVILALSLAWATLGLTALGRLDVAGAVGSAVFCVFLLRGRAPTLYGGVFLAVAALEFYGTAIGTWTWRAEVPGLGWPDGNPPSGAVSGYVLFDITALALAPWLLTRSAAVAAWWERRAVARSRIEPEPTALPESA
jgi:hypothetical protein